MMMMNLFNMNKKENKEYHPGISFVEKNMVDKISKRTGVSKQKVHKSLSVFRLAFKKYLKGDMKKPLLISPVFKMYRGVHMSKSLKTKEQLKNWRETDNNSPYKKE